MGYHANADGAVWFVREIWPHLRQHVPQMVLTIVGASPSTEVLALRNEPGVEVTGSVPDTRPYYAEAFAAIVPLRVGAGTRLKILEGMAARVPVVSTEIGAEGLDVSPGENILIAENPQDWIRAFFELRNDSRRSALIAAGQHLVQSRYDWNTIGDKIDSTYKEWLDNHKPLGGDG
jgi:glycosyltransferase involved in cell wall biosynthesis